MNMPDFCSSRSPRRELQGPRPTPLKLKVHKDSHKIRKPPAPPPPAGHPPQHAPPPVIIYTVSPKIIHANPNEFMSLVQRLTGPNATSPSSAAISPAARFASIERTKTAEAVHQETEILVVDGVEIDVNIQRTAQFPGILSPNPNILPPIPFPPNFFSSPLNFLHELSPVWHSNGRNYSDNSFLLQSPSTFILNTPSPNTIDLLHSLFDL